MITAFLHLECYSIAIVFPALLSRCIDYSIFILDILQNVHFPTNFIIHRPTSVHMTHASTDNLKNVIVNMTSY